MSKNNIIKVRCSELETLRNNVQLFVDNLTSDNSKSSGGSHGMFACWMDVARYIHLREKSLKEGVRDLKDKFKRFDEDKYAVKQAQLIKQLETHYNAFLDEGYKFVEGVKRMKWQVTKNVVLSGNTPWIFAKDDKYYGILFSENEINWRSELRFPLFQQYISDTILQCDSDKVSVGIFNVSANKFDLYSHSKEELATCLQVTQVLFDELYAKYKRAVTPLNKRSTSLPISQSPRPPLRPFN